jgi:hypothetical protein
VLLQQNESAAQIWAAQVSQLAVSLVPVAQTGWAQLPPPHDWWQTEATSATQVASHELLQQNESAAQIWAAQVSQLAVSAPPVEQIGWPHEPPPVQVPPGLQVWPAPQVPHEPPQPSSPQVLALQVGTQVPPPPSTAPLGEPMPVGPSQPAPALHSAVPQLPFLPVVMSKNCEACWYE